MKFLMPQVEKVEWSTERQQGDEIFIIAMPSTGFPLPLYLQGENLLESTKLWTFLFPFGPYCFLLKMSNWLHWKLSTDSSGSWFSRREKILKMWNNYSGVSKFTMGLCSSSIIHQWGTMLIWISAFSVFSLIGCLVRIKSRRKVEHADRFPWIMHMVHPLNSSSWQKRERFF